MDSFIELGYFDYLVNNFSRVGKLPDNATFYKIKRAQQMGISHNELFSRGKCFNGNIVDDKVSAYGIDEKNGPVEVGQYYFEAKRPDLAVYDDFVAENDNAGPLVLVWTNFFIKKLESFVDPSNPYIYDFDGIYISRFKVLRYYETLIKNRQAGTVSSLLYAVCKNSILTKAEFDILEKCINNYFKGKARDNLQK